MKSLQSKSNWKV